MSLALEIFLVMLSVSSVAIAATMVWYVKKVLLRMAMLVDADREILNEIKEYTAHLQFVNGLETFYGDETLAGLLRHSEQLTEMLENRISDVEFVEEEESIEEIEA